MKLTIELVPKTSFFSNVRSEVDPEIWDKIRRKSYAQSEYKCEVCGGKGNRHPVECHEIWEYKKGVQKLVGFISLCPKCHQVKHFGLSQIRGLEKECIEHLSKINKITIAEAEKYIVECFEVWIERSRKNWKLDVSFIDEYMRRIGE